MKKVIQHFILSKNFLFDTINWPRDRIAQLNCLYDHYFEKKKSVPKY